MKSKQVPTTRESFTQNRQKKENDNNPAKGSFVKTLANSNFACY